MMDGKLKSLEEKMSKQQEQHEQQMLKLQAATDKTFVFMRKGNEAQFKFNKMVKEKLVEASTSINNGDVGSAFQHIAEGIQLINNRINNWQKLVKLADSPKTDGGPVKSTRGTS